MEICNTVYESLVTNVDDPTCTHCHAEVEQYAGSPLSVSIDRQHENIKSYDPRDGQVNHVACLFCQRALAEVDWEQREEFHTQGVCLRQRRID